MCSCREAICLLPGSQAYPQREPSLCPSFPGARDCSLLLPSLSPHFSTVLLFPSGFLVLHYICLGVESFSVTPTRGPLHYMRQGLTTLVFCNLFCPRTAPIFQNYTYIPELPLYPRTASIQNWPHFLELPHISELPPYFRTTSIFQNCPHIPELPPYSRTAPIFQNCTYIPSLYLLKFMKSWILFTD